MAMGEREGGGGGGSRKRKKEGEREMSVCLWGKSGGAREEEMG